MSKSECILRPVYTEHQRQRCDYDSDIALIENNGVTPILSDSIVFNQSILTSIIAALTLTSSVSGPYTLLYVSFHAPTTRLSTLNS